MDNLWFSYGFHMMIFYSYVSLPEGTHFFGGLPPIVMMNDTF